jgi:hypothetical protein
MVQCICVDCLAKESALVGDAQVSVLSALINAADLRVDNNINEESLHYMTALGK